MVSENSFDNSIQLRGIGGQEFVPAIYDHLFTTDYAYTFTIKPKSIFWNFGIHFSSNTDFSFNKEAFLSKQTATLFLSAGESDPSNNVKLPSILKLSQINLNESPAIIRQFDPNRSGDITLTLSYDSTAGALLVSVNTGLETSEHVIEMKPYPHFKIVAWGEWEPFELTCDIERYPVSTVSTTATTTAPPAENETAPPDYYLIKLRDETWNTRSFQPGMAATFDSYLEDDKKRSEYHLFAKLKTGDQLIGYECESDHEIVCVFTVTAPVTADNTNIGLQISRCILPPIPIAHFRQKITFTPQLTNANLIRLFSLTKTQFDNLLTPRPVNDPHTQVLTSFTSDDHQQTKDQLAFSYDILSFATVIALKSVKPPLAIGLFGNWGSGKSFFMEQLEKEIDAKATSPGGYFVQHVVQVKFNSWHYSDANLWASLITEIFDRLYAYANERDKIGELEKLSETLQIANLQKGAAEVKKQELELRQQQLEKQQETKREELKDISGLGLAQLIIQDTNVQKDLKSLEDKNVEKIFENVGIVNNLINEVQKDANKWIYFFKTWLSLKGRWQYVIPAVFIVFAAAALVIWVPAIAAIWHTINAKILAVVGVIIPIAKSAWNAYKPVRERFNMAYARLVSLKETIESRPQQVPGEQEENKQQLQSVKKSIEILDQKINDTQKALDDIRSGRKLLEFIEQRSRDEQYAKQLGLVSWIRKDFKKLDELLRQIYEVEDEDKRKKMNPTDIKLRIDRIVLYIDDLDRCKEDIVVNVLEAVHLLLAFPLFVVVVGVDPRWLNKSLNKKYPFFSNNGKKQKKEVPADANGEEEDDDDIVPISSFDYLEKIFQIPFSLKPITKEGREGLIGYLVEKEIEKKEETAPPTPTHTITPATETGSAIKNQEEQRQEIKGATIEEKPAPGNGEPKVLNTTATGIGVTAADANLTALKAMKFSQDEVDYMKDVSILFGHTPRTIKRFVNIYRLIKSNRGLDPLTDYRATLLVLAIIVGCPEHAQTFILELEKSNLASFNDLINQTSLTSLRTWMLMQLNNSLIPKQWREQSISSLQANQELISRFSFRTYAM